jgi:ATP-dependent DNA helicase RecQ
MISVDIEGFGSLRLTEKSRPILRGETTLLLRKDEKVVSKGRSSQKANKETVTPDDRLWQALKEQRMALAIEQGVPPYVIFHDSTLSEIHSKKPQSLHEFRLISGVGDRKLQRYGDIFIAVISPFLHA